MSRSNLYLIPQSTSISILNMYQADENNLMFHKDHSNLNQPPTLTDHYFPLLGSDYTP